MNNKPLIISCLIYNGEQDILEINLNENKDVIDYWCIIEAGQTQCRNPKPFYFEQHKERFVPFLDRIVYTKLENFDKIPTEPWGMEHWTRNNLITGLQYLIKEKNIKIKSTDYFIFQDNDEIVDNKLLKQAIQDNVDLVSFDLRFISYYMNLFCPHRGWFAPILGKFEIISTGISPQQLRDMKDQMSHPIGTGGWHFSSIGGFETWWNKLFNTIEPLDKSSLMAPEAKEKYREIFNNHVLQNKYFLFSDNINNKSIKLEVLPDNQLPQYVLDNKDKFKHLLLPEEVYRP